jgi:uncharacterized membrane protein YebE (DUF533 family)
MTTETTSAGLLDALRQAPRGALARGALVALGAAALARLLLRARPAEEEGDEGRAVLLAMVAAAQADGRIDEEEMSAIEAELDGLPPSLRATYARALREPMAPEAVAALAHDAGERRDVYAASVLVTGRDHPLEAAHLDRLAAALGLSASEARAIEADLSHP